MGKAERAANRRGYFSRLFKLLSEYPRLLIVSADHVGSKQMAGIRVALRGKAQVLMGKNTMIRTALRTKLGEMPQLAALLPLIKLNIGFVFCGVEPAEVRDIIGEHKVPAPARQGVFAPVDVFIPAGPTGMDPGSTSFFQALGISTKIVKGQIEIQNQVHLIKQGDKVSASAATLLHKLNIKPFEYGLKVEHIYDNGSVYSASVLDITDETILTAFRSGVSSLAAFSRELALPTAASAPHSIIEGFKYCAALCLDTDFVHVR
ncbi:ribosomal protein rpp0 [Cyclospora cayetanensis]|uniref:Ribosomal protein rpp0 n=1 Tax=Cyclospora cayetanensis TaxID=88456 RepID=A0A1D3CS77_9EIME|nr:ribosomal protein rpp0 [Cyclospora cayetanensis]